MILGAHIALGILAALQIYFYVLESFLWTKPLGRKVFGMSAEQAEKTRVLALNQGYYNLILALGMVAGIAWDLSAPGSQGAYALEVAFSASVVFAGLVGGLTASKAILGVQLLPALIALGLVVAAH